MFKGYITQGAYTSGYVPIKQVKNTNDIFELRDNEILVKKPGIIDVKAHIAIVSTGAGKLIAQMYANGQEITNAAYAITQVSGNEYNIMFNEAIIVQPSANSGYVRIGIKLSGECELDFGSIALEYRP